MKKLCGIVLSIGLSVISFNAVSACPVGKQGGGTWCMNGYEWKCEKCGSEYCSIMTGRKCVKDDAQDAKLEGNFLAFLQRKDPLLTLRK